MDDVVRNSQEATIPAGELSEPQTKVGGVATETTMVDTEHSAEQKQSRTEKYQIQEIFNEQKSKVQDGWSRKIFSSESNFKKIWGRENGVRAIEYNEKEVIEYLDLVDSLEERIFLGGLQTMSMDELASTSTELYKSELKAIGAIASTALIVSKQEFSAFLYRDIMGKFTRDESGLFSGSYEAEKREELEQEVRQLINKVNISDTEGVEGSIREQMKVLDEIKVQGLLQEREEAMSSREKAREWNERFKKEKLWLIRSLLKIDLRTVPDEKNFYDSDKKEKDAIRRLSDDAQKGEDLGWTDSFAERDEGYYEDKNFLNKRYGNNID